MSIDQQPNNETPNGVKGLRKKKEEKQHFPLLLIF